MERLIKDANEYAKANGMAADLSINSFSDIVTAIDLIQQKQGIAGTTAKEAATTIEGSTNMMKAAWGNLLVGIADDNANFGVLIDNFIKSILTVADNIAPRLEKILLGIGDLVTQLVAKMFPKIISFINKYLPQFLQAAEKMLFSIAQGLMEAVPSLINTVLKIVQELLAAVPSLINIVSKIVQELLAALGEMVPRLATTIVNSLPAIITALMLMIPSLINAIVSMVNQIASELPNIIQAIVKILPSLINTIVNGLKNTIPLLIEGTVQLWSALAMAIPEAIPIIIEALPQIAEAIFNGLVALIPVVLNAIPLLFSKMKEMFLSYYSAMAEMGKGLMGKLVEAIKRKAGEIVDPIRKRFTAVKQVIISIGNAIRAKAASTWNGIKDKMVKPIQTAVEKIKAIIKKIKAFFPVNVGKIFSGWIPKISLKTNKRKDSADTSSTIKEEHFAKAMNQPYMFNDPTFFAAGEAGDEMLYGRKALMDDIAEATSGNAGNVYNFYNTITVDGADDPEEFANRLLRKLKIQARTV